ncbi:hypothetical protein MAR_006822 [Mya arenaria]|uniref:Uncharacterized protein n=1 Tax=Mya arenaria TaxID=6604 RepID=A0ABY7D9M0_MYAAR|nr:hypothetical protein MAR_006822 [Mya arenaria]
MAFSILKALTLLVVVSQAVFCQENSETNVQDNSTLHTNATTANRSTSENAATTENAPTTPAITTSTSTESHGNWNADLESRLERSRNAHLQFLRQHVLSSLGWTTPPNITAEEKRQILMGIGYRTPVFVTRQKFCYFPALNHRNMRLIDARMVTWDSARWVNLEVTEAVKRVMSRGRRNGGFEVHVRDMEENVLDAKTVIDPTVCSFTTEYDCTDDTESQYEEEPTEVNYSPVLEIRDHLSPRWGRIIRSQILDNLFVTQRCSFPVF